MAFRIRHDSHVTDASYSIVATPSTSYSKKYRGDEVHVDNNVFREDTTHTKRADPVGLREYSFQQHNCGI